MRENMAFHDWTLYARTAATGTSQLYYSEDFGTWMGKNYKIYDQSWGGNGYTGGKYKFAENVSNGFKWVNRAVGGYNALNLGIKYYSRDIDAYQFWSGEISNGISTFSPGLYGVAWSLGWESGRLVTEQSWYQKAKFDFWSYMWQLKVGPPSYENRYDWEYFYNNYKP